MIFFADMQIHLQHNFIYSFHTPNFDFGLVCANQIFTYTQENQLDKLILARNREQLAILLYLANLSTTGKNIIFSHNDTIGS